MITVFTPAYNRCHTLPRLYESLCGQTSFNFEWVVVDDGSTDGTEALLEEYIRTTSFFPIAYYKQPNGGKHRAVNRGVRMAKGDYFFIVDSDDYLQKEAIAVLGNALAEIEKDNRYCGVVALKCDAHFYLIGKNDEKCLDLDTDFLSYRVRYKMKGDRAEVVRTSVMKEFPFPEFPGETFCTEALVWNRIAQKYIARYINAKIYICQYLKSGLTASIRSLNYKNPHSMALYYSELASYSVPGKIKIKAAVNYWRYALRFKDISKNCLGWMYLFLPIGAGMALIDYIQNR